MRAKILFFVASFTMFGMIGAPAQAGLVGDGTNTVTAFFYFNAPSTPPPVCNDQVDAFCEQQYDFNSMNMKQTVLTIPAQFVQAPSAGVTIDVEDTRIVITNQLPATFCADGTSAGSACTDIFTGSEFQFSAGVDITGVSVDASSPPNFLPTDTPNGTPPHFGLQLLSPTEILVDLTGANPAIGGQLTLDVTTNGTTPVPDPSTWALMALGFAGLGFAGWRRMAAQAT